MAAAIAYLASPLAGATTGTALAVDGGMSGLRLRSPTAAAWCYSTSAGWGESG